MSTSLTSLGDAPLSPAHELRARLLDAYSLMECRKALVAADQNLEKAALWLTSGHWRAAKLISWDWPSLKAKAEQLSQETARSVDECLETLKDCSGSLPLARRRMTNLPILG